MHRQGRPLMATPLGELDGGEPLRGHRDDRSLLLGVVGERERRGAVGAQAEGRPHQAGSVAQHEPLRLDGVGGRDGRGLPHDDEGGEADQGHRAESLQALVLALQAVESLDEVLMVGVTHDDSSYFLALVSSPPAPAACRVTVSPTSRNTTLPLEAL